MFNVLQDFAVVGIGVLIGIAACKIADKKTDEEKIEMEEIPEEIMDELDDESIAKLKEIKMNIKKECRKKIIFNTFIDGFIKIGIPLTILRLVCGKGKRLVQ